MKRFGLFIISTVFILAVFSLTACGGDRAETVPDSREPESQGVGSGSADGAATDGGASDSTATVDSAANDDNDTVADDEPEPGGVQDFVFKMGDVLIEMDQDISHVLGRLGEPSGIFERPSCAFDGMDIIYGYPDVEIYTYPVGNNNHIHTVNFINDSPRTLEGGIRMGVPLQSVLDAYGDDYEYDTGMYVFTRGLTTLSFFIEDGIVWGITYGFIIE